MSKMYAEASKGHPPVPPAQLALTVIRQAYTKASDAEAIEALTMDRRWQLVVGCLECEVAPFSRGDLGQISTSPHYPPIRSTID